MSRAGDEQAAPSPDPPSRLKVEYCGTWHDVPADDPFVIGRVGDIEIDDNPYLHRRFLEIRHDRFWWIANVGTKLTATVSDASGDGLQAWLTPGSALPLVLGATDVRFTAGPTSYLMSCHLDAPLMAMSQGTRLRSGSTTLKPLELTLNQKKLVLSLAEASLRDTSSSSVLVPPSAEAAGRLGWTITKFNRQLDAVCQKLSRAGVQGVHGDLGSLASSRRARLVEYALAVRLVTADDLPLLAEERASKP